MRKGHIAAAAPAALSYGWTIGGLYADPLDPGPGAVMGGAGPALLIGAICVFSVMLVCTAPDWDHPRFIGHLHPGAALVRWSARLAYRIRTPHERQREDVHRGPSHTLEAAVLVGLLTVGLLSISPHTDGPLAWWIGLGVTIGWADHVLVDAMTPSGVPLCATWNYLAYTGTRRQVWRRHAFSWRWHAKGEQPKTLRLPRLTMIPVDESHRGCRPGLFYTDSGAEHLLVVPGFYALTGALVLLRAGVAGVVLSALTGVTV